MAMVCGLDLHRRQVTFGALGVDSGEEWRGPYLVARPGAVAVVAGQ
jgi:hypothetical protein